MATPGLIIKLQEDGVEKSADLRVTRHMWIWGQQQSLDGKIKAGFGLPLTSFPMLLVNSLVLCFEKRARRSSGSRIRVEIPSYGISNKLWSAETIPCEKNRLLLLSFCVVQAATYMRTGDKLFHLTTEMDGKERTLADNSIF